MDFELLFEAENTTLQSPMTAFGDADASGGTYVANTETGRAEVQFTLDVPATSTYYLWARLYKESQSARNIVVGIDGFRDEVTPSVTGQYEWVRIEAGDGTGNFALALSGGRQRMRIVLPDAETRIDAFFITGDANQQPPGVSVRPAVTATPTRTPTVAAADTATPRPSDTATAVPTPVPTARSIAPVATIAPAAAPQATAVPTRAPVVPTATPIPSGGACSAVAGNISALTAVANSLLLFGPLGMVFGARQWRRRKRRLGSGEIVD